MITGLLVGKGFLALALDLDIRVIFSNSRCQRPKRTGHREHNDNEEGGTLSLLYRISGIEAANMCVMYVMRSR
jgi:hypothetical protein